ncbi:hypothetical protein GOP47_0030683 [Adiantum capillus-veneris]|nr:hypothetical protein GOP47_0030683 [Adiantum capillus-veneris]
MHYIDFPDEKTNFMKVYQQDPSGKKKRVLMVRPSFPLILMGVEESIINDATGPAVVVDGDWLVGDLVDWFTDGCFWAARITAVLNKGFVQVELPSAPYGEGGSYEASIKDIRPSLDWSMDKVWTVPRTLKAYTMDAPSQSVPSPVQDLETLDTGHIFIAKQEPRRIPLVQDLNITDAHGVNNLIASSRHAQTVTANTPNVISGRVVKESAVVTANIQKNGLSESAVVSMDMQKNGVSECPQITSLGDKKVTPPDFHGRGFASANKPPNKGQLLRFSTSEWGLGSSSCQRPEGANQVRMRETSPETLQKPPPQTDAVDLNGRTEIEQNTLSKIDALSTLNDMGETLLFKELNFLLEDEKLLDLSDERIGSSIVALEELISRIAWLRGVMQFGLKGWCKERRKRKWVFFEKEDHPFARSENSADLVQKTLEEQH